MALIIYPLIQTQVILLLLHQTLVLQKVEKTKVTIDISTSKENLIANGEILKFDGFLKVYFDEGKSQSVNKNILPPIKIGDGLNLLKMDATQKFSQPPARFSEATLVKKLEELGIGRPSTYAPTISTIQKRKYVVQENRKGNKKYINSF